MNKIIAISGLKNAGKSTVASMLEFLLNTPKIFHSYFFYKHQTLIPKKKSYKTIAFADPIKEMLSCLLNMDRWEFESRNIKENCIVCLKNLSKIYTNGYDIDAYNLLSDSKFSKIAKEWNPELSKQYYLSIRQVMQLFGTEIMRNTIDDKIWINCVLNRSYNQNLIISDLRFITEYEEIKNRNGFIIYIDRGLTPGLHKSESEMQTLLNQNKFDLIIDNKNINLKELFNLLKANLNKIKNDYN